MHKAAPLLIALSAFGGTLASAASTTQNATAVMPLSASVSNVCTYAPADRKDRDDKGDKGDKGGQSTQDVNGKTVTAAATVLTTYTALGATNSAPRLLYTLRCTSFTPFTPQAVSGLLTLKSPASDNDSHTDRTLSVSWTLDAGGSQMDKPGVGDLHVGTVTFSVPAGQWNAAAGRYSGVLSVNISYQ